MKAIKHILISNNLILQTASLFSVAGSDISEVESGSVKNKYTTLNIVIMIIIIDI